MEKTYIKEIFSSIQGEGLLVGQAQTFVRFSRCNLNCRYCDTDFSEFGSKKYTSISFVEEVSKYLPETISLTGGEPLLETPFLIESLPKLKRMGKKIYLETNGTLPRELEKIIDFVDIIAMDIKIQTATGEKNRFDVNRAFLKLAHQKKKKIFIKVVFTPKIEYEEIAEIISIAKENMTPVVLQPKYPIEGRVEGVFDKFYGLYKNVRLIPQTHKFLDLP